MNKKISFPKSKQNDDKKWHSLSAGQAHCLLTGSSVLVVFLLFCLFRHLSPFIYQTNDDLFLKMIASGEMSGTPESRLYFISYPAGLILSLLYGSFPAFPWYGIFLCFSSVLTMTLVLRSLLLREKNLPGRTITVLLFSILCYGFLFTHIAQLQFTTSAGIAAAGALFLFSLSPSSASFRETLKNNAGALLLSAYAFCIRDQVLFMSLPFFGMIGLSKYLDARTLPGDFAPDKRSGLSSLCKNRRQKNLLRFGVLFLFMLASFLLIEKIAYHGDDWRSFRTYSLARAAIYDYDGYPDYDAYAETYRELGLSRSSYEGAAHRYSLILDPAIDRHTMEVLEDLSKQGKDISLEDLPKKLREMADFFWERHRSDADKPLNLLVYRCYLLFIICAVSSRKWRAFRDISFALFARMIIWSYLLFYGRLPIRISQTIYLLELSVLFSAAFGNQLWEPHKNGNRKCSVFWILSTAVISFTCFRSGIPDAEAAAKEAKARLQFSESFVSIKDYFAAHPDCFYYLDTNSFAYFTEDALQTGDFRDGNYIFMGGWAAKSPWYEKKFERMGISDPAAALYETPPIYAVFMDTEETGYDYLEAFYAENHPGVHLKVIETVEAGNELSFSILKGFPEEIP